jgi:hypothetical protein
MLTVDLLSALVNRDGEPWGEWWGAAVDRGDTRGPGYRLAKLIKPFGVTSKTMRVDGAGRGKGYDVTDFLDVFARYVSDMGSNDVTTGQAMSGNDFSPDGGRDNDVPRPDGDGLSRRHVDAPLLEREEKGNGNPSLLTLAGRHGYPTLAIRPAVTIPAGLEAWVRFITVGTGEDREAARVALEAIG